MTLNAALQLLLRLRSPCVKGDIMDSSIIFALVLAVLFFGSITWLIIHSRLQEARSRRDTQQPSPENKVAPGKLETR